MNKKKSIKLDAENEKENTVSQLKCFSKSVKINVEEW